MKNPQPVDVYVGKRVRARRIAIGVSQEKLAESLDVTFQQVQKYEKGSNRISCSRLVQISRALAVAPSFFFEGLPSDGEAPSSSVQTIASMMATREGAELCKVWPDVEAAGKADVVLGVARMAVMPAANAQAA